MVSDDLIKRVNELWHKQQTVGLTEEEKAEQKEARAAYVAATKNQVREMLKGVKPAKQNHVHSHKCSCKHCNH